MIRLGLFLVYTLPPSSNTPESGWVFDDDLSDEITGTQHKQQTHVTHYLSRIYHRLLLIQSCLLFAVAQSSSPAGLLWIRNQVLLVLCEVLNSDSLLIKE